MRRMALGGCLVLLVGCEESYVPPAYPTYQAPVQAYYYGDPIPTPDATPPAPTAPPPPPSRADRYFASLPPYRPTTLPTREELVARWQLPPVNVWSRYQKYTLLTALDSVPHTSPLPDVRQLGVVTRAEDAARCLAAAGLPNDTMWIVDTRGAASVAFGAALSAAAREPVSLVMTFNNWPAENELIPAEETLSALVSYTPRLPGARDGATRPVFLLDAWRLAYRFDVPEDDVTDNRYVLGPTDLPSAATLRAQGITRVAYVVEDLADTPTEEDDLYPIFREYQAAGITLYMMDLSVCGQPVARGRMYEVLAPRVYVCPVRRTLLDDVDFYVRARGGFGGVHVAPGGAHWGGHVGGGGG